MKTLVKAKKQIGKRAGELLRTKKSYAEVLEQVHNEFPDAKTTMSSLRWYASKMRQNKVKVPERARAVRGEG